MAHDDRQPCFPGKSHQFVLEYMMPVGIGSVGIAENFYHNPDDTVFHGSSEYPDGYLFSYARALTTENEKILKLKERLNGYYVNGLASVEHPFMTAILTCVGLEVLGQVFLGFDSEGKTIETIQY
jgi:hypothetical protein